ncbi:MAG: hypothetical protein HYX38_34225 [Rhodospirillales bacterium]|nr:hypothetical protein [Rhodospirillales bacterium]
MSKKVTLSFLERMLGLMVSHFGAAEVRATLDRLTNDIRGPTSISQDTAPRLRTKAGPPVRQVLEELKKKDEEAHSIVSEFYSRLLDRKVLPQSEDVRRFGHLIGMKKVPGKARKDMLPIVVRTLVELPVERIKSAVASAATMSEEQRRQGYGILTDRLLKP